MPGSKLEAERKPKVEPSDMEEKAPAFMRSLQADGGLLDTTKVYTWSEACTIRDTFVRMVIQQTADAQNWFAAYRIQKVNFANKGIMVLDREKLAAMKFESYEAVIEFMEKTLRAMGYECVRRETFSLISTLPAEQLLANAEYMVSVLLSEYEWENSLKYFKTKDPELGPPRYMIQDDIVFTPQAHTRKGGATKSTRKDLHGDAVRAVEASLTKKEPPVQRRLDFEGIAKDDTTPDKKMDPGVDSNTEAMNKLLGLADEGVIEAEDVAWILHNLHLRDNGRSRRGDTGRRPNSKAARRAKYESSGDESSASQSDHKSRSRRKAARYATSSEDDSSDFDEEHDEYSSEDEDEEDLLISQDVPFTSSPGDRHVTTVLQNVQLKTYDARARSVEEAKQWLSKFIYAANVSNWTPQQRLDSFQNHLSGGARYWFKQLPRKTRKTWKSCLKAFHSRYCVETLSVRRAYYKNFQRADENPVEYLYRLNAAAQQAGVDIRHNRTDRKDHIALFFDTLHENALPVHLCTEKYRTMKELEHKLLKHEARQVKPAKKTVQITLPKPAKSQDARVNVMGAPEGPHMAPSQYQSS